MRNKIMRFVIYVMGILTLASCSILEPSDYTKTETTESLLGAFNTPDGKMYLLGSNMDYEIESAYVKDTMQIFDVLISSGQQVEFLGIFGNQYAGDQIHINFDIPKTYFHTKKYPIFNKFFDTYKGSECRKRGQCEFFTVIYVKRVKVANCDEILKNSAFAKPYTIKVKTEVKKHGVRRAVEHGVAGTVNTVAGAVALVTAPIWIPVGFIYMINSDVKPGW